MVVSSMCFLVLVRVGEDSVYGYGWGGIRVLVYCVVIVFFFCFDRFF